MENLFDAENENVIASLMEAIPIFQAALPIDCMFSVADKEKFLFYRAGEEVDAKVSQGDTVPEKSGLHKCQQSGEQIVQILPPEVYGVSVKTSSVPIKNKCGDIIGAFSMGMSINTQKMLHEAAQNIAANAEEINATMEELASSSSKLAQDLDFLRNKGDSVIGEIKKTSEILQFVNGLYKNANLLGINAAIEAARAGEQGRGFSIVANEIRKMADDSANYVKSIGVILESIQTGVASMVNNLLEITQIGEEQASATEEVSASMQQLASSAVDVERVAETVI